MHDQRDRIAGARPPVPGLERIPVDFLAARALEGKLLGLAEPDVGQRPDIHLRQRSRGRAALDQVQVGRRGQALQCEHDAAACGVELGDVAEPGQLAPLEATDVDREQRPLAEVVGGGEDLAPVRREPERRDRTVPVARGEADRATRGIAHDEAETVGLEAGPFHRQVREQAAVRRVRGLRVPGGIVRRQVDGRAAAVGWNAPDVEVGGDRLELPAQPRREHDLRSVRAERIVRAPAVRLRRDVRVERRRERHRLAARPPLAVERDRKELGNAPVLPRVPVADEEPVVNLCAPLRRALLVEPLAGAFEIAAVREDLHRDDQPAAARRRPESRDVERQSRDLRRLAAADRQEPYLRRTAARGEEEDAAAIGGPVGGAVVLRVAGEPSCGSAAVQFEHPQVIAPAVGREVGLAQRVDEQAPVGRDRGFRDSREFHEVLGRQPVRRRAGQQRERRHRGGRQESSRHAALGLIRPNTLE